jgi:CHASE3 domain sensor protein
MADERITTYETPEAHHTTTIVHDGESRSGGGAVWMFGIVLLIAVLAAVYFLATRTESQSAKDNAITEAAQQVGTAANKVGNAAEEAANNVSK